MRKIKSAATLALVLMSCTLSAQSNALLERDFWKTQPSLEMVAKKINQGNDPSELNRFAFDPLIYAILEKAPMETLLFLLNQEGNDVNKITHDGRTYVFWAAYKGNLALMKHLVGKGAAVDIVDEHGYSLLNFAAVTGQQDSELYDFIFAQNAQVKEEKNNDGANALLLLIPHLDNPEMIEYFEEKELSIYDKDDLGNTSFNYAAAGGHIKMLTWLIEKGVQQKAISRDGATAMHFAAEGTRRHKNSAEVFQFIKDQGVNPNKANIEGRTPLMIYASDGEEARSIEFFLANGADPDQADNEGNSSLMNAAKYNDLEIISLLLAKSKNVNAVNKKGHTALTNAVYQNTPAAISALIGSGAEIDVRDKDGNSLVYYLVESYLPSEPSAFEEKAELLESNGVRLTAEQGNGNTFFHLAAEQNQIELLKKAQTLGLDVNAQNSDGFTPLHLAAMKTENIEILKYLVSIGADIALTTAFEESAHQLAQENELLQTEEINLSFLQN